MDMIQLQYFRAAAEDEHFTRAAARLNVTQPTLSASISRLENELGCSLFDRSGRQVTLNQNGQILLRYAKMILKDYDSCIAELSSLARRDLNELSLACVTMHVHRHFIHPFLKKHPEIRISQQLLLSDKVSDALSDPEIDFCIVNMLPDQEDVGSLILRKDLMYLAVARKSPLARMRTYKLEDLTGERFVVNPGGTGYVTMFNSMFQRAGLPLPKTFNALPSDWQDYLNDGFVCLGTEMYFTSGAFDSRIVFIPPENEELCTRTLYLAWDKSRRLTKAAKIFLEEMKAWAAENTDGS